jgi:hypothetical protein
LPPLFAAELLLLPLSAPPPQPAAAIIMTPASAAATNFLSLNIVFPPVNDLPVNTNGYLTT